MRDRRATGAYISDTQVPFIDVGESTRSFSDIGNEGAVDNPLAMTAGWRGIRNNLEVGPNFEITIGADRSLPSGFLPVMADYRRCVCKISVRGTNYRGQTGSWSGTGFLVGKNLLLTNHHVLHSIDSAENAVVDFEFEQPVKDFLSGIAEPPKDTGSAGKRFKLDPRRLFVTSPATNGGLDYTFVWIGDEAAQAFGHIPLVRAAFGAYENEQAFILHHPEGRARRVSLDDTDILRIYATVLRYTSDTMPGSSGSPVFNRQCRLIALHHASQEDSIARPDGRKYSALNEGIKIAAIAIDLERRRNGNDGQMIGAILAEIQGSDTLSGYFGALGRSPLRSTGERETTAVEAVVDTYRGTDADLDIGFWNIEWLSNRYTEPDKLRMAAALIVDLGLDIWGLSEVSPNAVRALVQELKHQFKEEYSYELSEPDATDGRQSTAVIWKQKTVEGKREEWPEDIERLWHLDSRDPLEAVDGKIFNRYPGLFRFKAKGKSGMAFHLVPLHLKAMEEGSKRRRLASKLLARAVKAMTERHGYTDDWVIGGDYNAELATDDFNDLLTAGFSAMSAEDERRGAMSYLKSPRSLIDHIFLSPNLAKHAGPDGFFIVAKEKSVDGYVNKLSDHRPVLIRLALTSSASKAKRRETDDDLDALADEMAGIAGLEKRPRRHDRRFEAGGYTLSFQGLTKQQFFVRNATEFARMREDVNARLVADHGAAAAPVTLKDFAVLLNCEGGLKGGKVDPDHEHSEGERGVFPLPSNIRTFWTGPDAPEPNEPMPLDENCFHFLLYLGRLKNKTVPGMALYKSHFQHAGIKGNARRESRLLAGIVHGYFVRANYGGAPIPKTQILDGYAADVPLHALMMNTGYVHAGKPWMRTRHDNIETALSW